MSETQELQKGRLLPLSDAQKEKAVSAMCRMIQCKTVSNLDDSLVDWSQFEAFRKLLRELYPHVYEMAEYFEVSKSGIIHRIAGTGDGSPGTAESEGESAPGASAEHHAQVLMAHYDVVPPDGQNWSFDPFAGDIVDGFIRGRGTLDTKGTLCACMEAVDNALASGWNPKEDLYLCFSGEEEINGASCAEIVSWFEKQNIAVDFVLDEGGAIVENAFPGVSKRCAMIGTAEKGSVYMDVTVEGKPGHASAPPKNSSVGLLSKAVCAIEKHPCKTEFTRPAKELFSVMGPNNKNGALRFLFSNLWLTRPLVSLASKLLGGELYAMLHTTCAVTRASGSNAYNVLPARATAGINFRLLGSDTVEKAKARVERYAKKAAGKKAKVSVTVVSESNPSRESDTRCPQWDKLCAVIHKTWPDILVSPYLMMACSDSRHYCRITDKIYRFSGMFLSKEERGMIHGTDERISCDTLIETVEFYTNLLEVL